MSIIIDSDGNINFNCRTTRGAFYMHYNYSGKLAEDFEYPYTIKLVYIATNHPCDDKSRDSSEISKLNPQSQTGTFTFHNESILTASYYVAQWSYNFPTDWRHDSLDFKKE